VHLAGETAAPVFAKVVAEILHILGVPPEDYSQEKFVAADFRVYDIPNSVFKKAPVRDREDAHGQPVHDTSQLEAASKPAGSVKVPNLVGRGLREAAALCRQAGLKLKATGDGRVATQNPAPGRLVVQNTVCTVRLAKQIAEKEKPLSTGYRPRYAVASGQQTRIKPQ
jgi:hypothetical protein